MPESPRESGVRETDDTAPGTRTGAGTGPETGVGADPPGSGTGVGPHSGTDSATGTGTDSGASTGTGTGTRSDSGPDAHGGPHASPGLVDPLGPFDPFGRLAKAAWQTVLVAGIAALVLGVLVLAWPGMTLLVVGVLFGVYLLVSGVTQLVAAFGTHTSTSLRVMAFISGALSILLGLFCFRSALQSILLLALWIGIGWLFRGITQTVAAASDADMPARGWQVFLGVISALAGIVLLVSPFESVAVLTVVGGCWLLALGIVEIVTSLRVRRRLAHRGHEGHRHGRHGHHGEHGHHGHGQGASHA